MKPRTASGDKPASTVPRAQYYKGDSRQTRSPFEKRPPASGLRRKLDRLLNFTIILILLAIVGYSLTLNGNPRIVASSYEYHPAATYQSAVIAASGFWQKTKLTYDAQKIINPLEKRFPEISGASVSLPVIGQTPSVHLVISPPAFIMRTAAGSYLLDTEGVAIAPTGNPALTKGLLTIDDQSGFEVKPGSRVLSAQNIAFIQQVAAQTKRARIQIASLVLPPRAEELDLKTADKPYLVKFYLAGDPLVQTGQFLAARNQFSKTHQDPSQYLDVRVTGKIFYK